ncbi:hypothetical protein KAFR_0F01570 [Kazachstania africana CBS 2517]|uniref:Elongation of fatty acids protein n=1 Tax=Kazachstania africana (strain ATCC 22294 / BCRC 22015 / CBS 2517 / CECT 1963 / NBRC 1671 / NRRL Y-8276) TaxID=1071382 RepID=H2AWK4_KAZAF|nr:hypothetical protein KAFR_0F01570 [Kazachstania africana CBS 2517]CCF58754.1 hypothetical protein KAFR_0F01570 [Kazachstania africana CBS 2517]
MFFLESVVKKYPQLLEYIPNVEKPFFNMSLWDNFDEFITFISLNKFVPKEFDFVPGQLPLSDLHTVLLVIASYYVIIFGGRELLRNTKPFKLNFLCQLHNLFLTIASLVLLVLMLEQILPIIYYKGLYSAICDIESWTQPMMTLYYLNYLVKFMEFIDTYFLVLKHKKLTFLHTYHHGATALLCYTELVGNTVISWVPITLNLAVHVIMYWYYFLSARGVRVWWKEWVTRLQIIQFIIDIFFIYFAFYQKLAYVFMPILPHCGDCTGSTTSVFAGCAIITSYLFLFVAFYMEVYRGRGIKKTAAAKKAAEEIAASSGVDEIQGPPSQRLRKRK